MLLSNLKCSLKLPEIEQRSSDWSTLIVSYKNLLHSDHFFNGIAFIYNQGKRTLSLIRKFWDTCIFDDRI
jgi:hypothetical protein